MEQPNRRKLLIVAGAGAGAVGVAAAKAGLTGPDTPPADPAAALPAGAGPLVAYVENARSGRVSVLTGEAEVTIELRAIAGATIPLVDPTYTPDAAAGAVTDGSDNSNAGFTDHFPYVGAPAGGFQSMPGTLAA